MSLADSENEMAIVMQQVAVWGLLDVANEAKNARIDWDKGSVYWCDWHRQVGSCVRMIWYSFSAAQRVAIACDAYLRERNLQESAAERQRGA